MADHSRPVYTELLHDEQAATVMAFVARALAFYAGHGVAAKHPQTDNTSPCTKNRSVRELLAREATPHRFIPPRTPKRNGAVERYQQTLARESGLRAALLLSAARANALPLSPTHYNFTSNHSGIGSRPPMSRARGESSHDI
jgi:transposase InsO family protein